jgi:hypothetical protein
MKALSLTQEIQKSMFKKSYTITIKKQNIGVKD